LVCNLFARGDTQRLYGNHGQRAVPQEEAAAQTSQRKSTITFFAAVFTIYHPIEQSWADMKRFLWG
jgi:hypothetical protein